MFITLLESILPYLLISDKATDVTTAYSLMQIILCLEMYFEDGE